MAEAAPNHSMHLILDHGAVIAEQEQQHTLCPPKETMP